MKYLITESKLNIVIFKYLDNQDFIKIEKGNKVYFVNSNNDEYAQIRYDKKDGWCFIYYKLIDEISSFFSIGKSNSQNVIGKWVENTLQMRVSNTFEVENYNLTLVENTLQMRVSNTAGYSISSLNLVENTLQMRVSNTTGYG
jgi:hypothetical protein